MASRLSGLFNSYDFFGKSIPGVVLLLGLVTFLPMSALEGAGIEISIRNVAVLALSGLVLGLIFGEGVHNIAINIEQIFYWSRRRTYDIFNIIDLNEISRFFTTVFGPSISIIRNTITDLINRIPGRSKPIYNYKVSQILSIKAIVLGIISILTVIAVMCRYWIRRITQLVVSIGFVSRLINYLQRENEPTPIYVLPYGLWIQARKWFSRRRGETYKGLVSHRNLFERRVELEFSQYESPDNGDSVHIERFNNAYKEAYDTDIRRVIDDVGDIYPIVTTRLDALEYGRADNFQARYSFCRSMWVTLGFFLFSYIIVLLDRNQREIEQTLDAIPAHVVQIISQNTFFGPFAVGLALGFVGGIILQYGIEKIFKYRLSENKPLAVIFAILCYGLGVIAAFELEQTMVISLEFIRDALSVFTWITYWCLKILWPISDILVSVLLGQDYVSDTVFIQVFSEAHIQIIVLLAITVAVFFDASGDYKELYIDYLIVEFAEAIDLEDNDETLNLLHKVQSGEEKDGKIKR